MTNPAAVRQAAKAVASAEALLIGAGAGMGVDSGLPDFRGNQGFWRAYPPYQNLGLDFVSLANPRWFASAPALAWGFYGHRLNLYRATQPHAAPVRSAAYTALTCDPRRQIASVRMRPPAKNGSAATT